jgi:regulation of enolase protein 1 (concanavalin A-like superfamily)
MPISLHTLPELSWTHTPGDADVDPSTEVLTLTAAAGVDWSNDALGAHSQHAATALTLEAPAGDFSLSARVRVAEPRTTFDAGALVLWSDDDHWAKLCFEFSPQGQPMVVSVVTDRYSDDCNSTHVTSGGVFLRVARIGEAWAFHSSTDGIQWDFVRLFRLDAGADAWRVGFLSQAPMGDTCTATFDRIALRHDGLADLRNGE